MITSHQMDDQWSPTAHCAASIRLTGYHEHVSVDK